MNLQLSTHLDENFLRRIIFGIFALNPGDLQPTSVFINGAGWRNLHALKEVNNNSKKNRWNECE